MKRSLLQPKPSRRTGSAQQQALRIPLQPARHLKIGNGRIGKLAQAAMRHAFLSMAASSDAINAGFSGALRPKL